MIKFVMALLIVIGFGMFANNSNADVLILDRINLSKSVVTPVRGSSMKQVIVDFGDPLTKKESIGNPPISVWKYEGFTVYFEKTWVINSVVNKTSAQDRGPKPISR